MKNKTNKKIVKEQEEKYSVEIYKSILSGSTKRFPHGFWRDDNALIYAKDITIYLIKAVLGWSEEDIKRQIKVTTFIDNKLNTMIAYLFNNSPYAALDNAYPGVFKPWELAITPNNTLWTDEKITEAIKWIIDKKGKINVKILRYNGLRTMHEYLCKNNKKIDDYIKILYPDGFKSKHRVHKIVKAKTSKRYLNDNELENMRKKLLKTNQENEDTNRCRMDRHGRIIIN
jgi:hypothetical protein